MEIVNNAFAFDNYKWQQENKISIKEKFRADSLNRVLYKCPHCLKEDMIGNFAYLLVVRFNINSVNS